MSLARALSRLGPEVSCDVETDGIKPLECKMLCVGFSDGVRTVIVWPWRPSFAAPLARFLRGRASVVFHNGYNFDHLVLGAHGVDLTGVHVDDTLIAHHTFASHFPQRLDHVVSEYCVSAPWKIEHGRRGAVKDEKGQPGDVAGMSAGDLARYNASDCRLTALAWRRMQSDLAPERTVYEHDKKLAEVCRSMIRVGIGVDVAKKERLSTLMKNRASALKGQIRPLVGRSDFQPSRLSDVRQALFGKFRTRIMNMTAGGLPSTSNATLEVMRGDDTKAARFASLMLDWRAVTKARGTYVGGTRARPLKFDVVLGPSGDRAHYNWKPFGTVSGRLSCRLQSCPKYAPRDPAARAREIYVPRAGCEFVYFDVSQAEMRLAAFMSADAAFMDACQGDVHANNAKKVFPEIAAKGWLDGDAKKDPERGKPYRDMSKNLGFAICYGAEADKVFLMLRSSGFDIAYRAVELVLARLKAAYRTYYRFVESNLAAVRKTGFMRSPVIGRIRWFGWWPKPTDTSNYPVQSALADVMNLRTIEMHEKLPVGSAIVAQIHDACIVEVPRRDVSSVERLIGDIWSSPVKLAGGDCYLPIDLKRGMAWSDF